MHWWLPAVQCESKLLAGLPEKSKFLSARKMEIFCEIMRFNFREFSSARQQREQTHFMPTSTGSFGSDWKEWLKSQSSPFIRMLWGILLQRYFLILTKLTFPLMDVLGLILTLCEWIQLKLTGLDSIRNLRGLTTKWLLYPDLWEHFRGPGFSPRMKHSRRLRLCALW